MTLKNLSCIYSILAIVASLSASLAHGANIIAPGNCTDFINEKPSTVTCGFISIAKNHDKPSGPRIKLPIVVAKSTRSATPKRAIFIPGAGGPGAAIGFGYAYNPGEFLAPYESLRRAGYDVVIVDQRGAGFSSPQLTCPETIQAFKTLIARERTLENEIDEYQRSIAQCRKRLVRDIGDIADFDTLQSSLDFLYIIEHLNYPWWGTIATSYATAISQAMVMLQPDVFNAVVLDSPVPLNYQQPITTETTYQSIVKTITRCEASERCNNRYPRLISQLDKVLESASHWPYRIEIKVYNDAGQRETHTLVVDNYALLAILSTAIYSNESIAALPGVIDKMYKGSNQAFNMFAEDYWYQSTDSSYADGLNVTVHCKERQLLEERYVKNNPLFLKQLSKDSRRAFKAQADLCKTWKIKSDNELLPEQQFNARALILAGSLDPVISDADVRNTANNFSNVSTATVPGASHSVWYQSECVRQQVVDFFNQKPTRLAQCESSLPAFK